MKNVLHVYPVSDHSRLHVHLCDISDGISHDYWAKYIVIECFWG